MYSTAPKPSTSDAETVPLAGTYRAIISWSSRFSRTLRGYSTRSATTSFYFRKLRMIWIAAYLDDVFYWYWWELLILQGTDTGCRFRVSTLDTFTVTWCCCRLTGWVLMQWFTSRLVKNIRQPVYQRAYSVDAALVSENMVYKTCAYSWVCGLRTWRQFSSVDERVIFVFDENFFFNLNNRRKWIVCTVVKRAPKCSKSMCAQLWVG